MSLSCECDTDDCAWYFIGPEDAAENGGYAPLATKRSRKCCSCKARIAVGDLSVRFTRFKYAEWGTVEANIYGEGGEVPLAEWYMCERCGDLYLSITELGYCIDLGRDDMREIVKEYAEMAAHAARAKVK